MQRADASGARHQHTSEPAGAGRWRLIRRSAVLAVAVGAMSSAAVAYAATGSHHAKTASAKPQKGGTLVVDVQDPILTLDPAAGSANAMALGGESIYDTLMWIPKLGEPAQPNIAKSMTASKNGLTWTMKLPTGIKFSDGTPFNAAAVVYNMKRDMAPSSSAAALLSSVKSVSAPNATTVVFHLKTPYSSFPDVFAYDGSGTAGYIASPTALKKWGKKYSAHASGVGPFKVQSYSAESNTVLVRNPNYWNTSQTVYPDKVVLDNITSDQTAYQSIQAGNVDIMGSADPSILAAAQKNSKVQTVMGDTNDNQDSIVLNLATPPFNNLSVRKALSMALNRNQIASLTTNGLGRPAVNLFPKGNPFHDSYSDPGYNPSGAQQLISQYTQQTGSAPTFTYTCNNQRPATDVIIQQLKAVGFNVTLDEEQTASWVSDYFAKKYQAICWTMAPFATPNELPYRFFFSTGDLNTGGFNSPAFDADANAGRAATSFAKQKANWDKADKVLTQQLPWVWTTSGPIGFILNKKVHGQDYSQPSRLRYYVPMVGREWLSH